MHDVLHRRLEYPQAGGIAGRDLFLRIKRYQTVGHRLEHRLVVVLHRLHVGKQLCVLERDRNLRGKRAQTRLVLVAERTAALVQNLRDAYGPAHLVDHRHAKDRAREVVGLLVERRIEAKVRIGVGNVDRLARLEHGAGNAEVIGQADLHRLQALPHFRPQFL